MKVTKIICCALILMSVSGLKAQDTDFDNINNQIENIPYVFEGQVVDIDVYAGDKEGNRLPQGVFTLTDGSKATGYISAKVQVCRIYKGGDVLKHGTVEIISTSSELVIYPYQDSVGNDALGYGFMKQEHGVKELLFRHGPGTKLVLFCTSAKYPGSSNRTFDNPSGLYPVKGNMIMYSSWVNDPEDAIAFGFGRQFFSEKEIKDFISQIQGLDLNAQNVCTDNGHGMIKPGNEIPAIDYQYRLDNYNSWLSFKQSFTPQVNSNKDINATALTLELANPSISGTSLTNKFFEFDIMIYASDNTTYFDNCLIRIQYSAGAFGSNVVANNNIVITRGPLYNNATYTNPNTDMIDQTGNTLGIPMGTDFNQSSWNRTAVTIFPEVLMHVKIEIQNCNQLTGFNFTDVSFTAGFNFYALTANADIVDVVNYDLTDYAGQINDLTCIPIIDSFTDNIPAGNGSIFTVTGNYFGTAMGADGTVIFMNADTGHIYPFATGPKKGGIQHYDVVSWSDDEIQIRLPGQIDSVPHISTGLDTDPVPGSGKFKVVNFTGNVKESPFDLTIPFAITPFIDLTPVYNKGLIQLAGINGSNGYTLHCNPTVEASLPGAKAIIRKALRDWSCVSGINWNLGSDMSLGATGDGVCIITLVPGNTGFLQATTREVGICSGPPRNYFLNSFDIEIGYPLISPQSWQVDSTGNILTDNQDFYHAIAHELGHGHILSHINDSLGDLMFWGAGAGPYPEAQRKRVWTSNGAMMGAIWMTTNAISPTCVNAHVLQFPSDCTGLSVSENDGGGITISSYPNPVADGFITVSFHLNYEARTRFVLYNELGQMLKATQELKTAGSIAELIYIGDLASGTYYIHVFINEVPYTVKLIKN